MKYSYISVYGTLRIGENANNKLKECKFISKTEENLPFKMLDLGSFPALVSSSENKTIVLETYKIPENKPYIKKNIDSYEGYHENGDGLYDKQLIKLKSGIESCIYYMKSEKKLHYSKEIISGDWKNR